MAGSDAPEFVIEDFVSTPWSHAVTLDADQLRLGLQVSGVPDEGIDDVMRGYDLIWREFDLPPPHSWQPGLDPQLDTAYAIHRGEVADRLRVIVSGIFSEEGLSSVESRDVDSFLPLLRFACPMVTGAEVTLKVQESGSSSASWQVKVAGSGVAPTATFRSSIEVRETAEPGQVKLLLVPIKVRVERLAMPDGSEAQGGFRSSVVEVGLGKGYRTEDVDRDTHARAPFEPGHIYVAQPRSSGKPSQVTAMWELTKSTTATIGIESDLVTAGLGATIESTGSVALDCILPVGHDYYLHRLMNDAGVRWQVQKLFRG